MKDVSNLNMHDTLMQVLFYLGEKQVLNMADAWELGENYGEDYHGAYLEVRDYCHGEGVLDWDADPWLVSVQAHMAELPNKYKG